MPRLLFICSQNQLRSPTAEEVFAGFPDMETASAGTNNDAVVVVTAELLNWADIIFVMERTHRDKIAKKFRKDLDGKRIVCLNIPDRYQYMEPKLVELLRSKVPRYLSAV